jgi:hypothetical protein
LTVCPFPLPPPPLSSQPDKGRHMVYYLPPPLYTLAPPPLSTSYYTEARHWFSRLAPNSEVVSSNGKSSIVEERLYSFFFAFFQKKTEASLFRFSSFTQLGTKTFVLLRSCKNFLRFTSLCFVIPNFWNNPIRFTFDFEKVGLISFASLCSSKILEQPGRFCFDLQKFRNKQFVLLSILLCFGINSFLLRS